MLKIHFGRFPFPNEILEVDLTFDLCVKNEWLNTEFAKRVVKGIDNTEHIKDGYLESPFWGAMSPQKLSTGCKNVLLMKFYSILSVFYGTKCGDNCVPYILEVAKEKDIELHLQHCMRFPDYGFEAHVVETDRYIHSCFEFFEEYVRYWEIQDNAKNRA